MSINWIATNPKPNVKNQANQISMSDSEFEELLSLVIYNRHSYEEKLELLLRAKGFFSAEQAAQLISTFARPKDKLKAVMLLEPKLVSMTCQQARNILAAVSIPEDKLQALEFVKRAINDANTQEGLDYIVSAFTYEEHKLIAARILQTVVAKKGVHIAAGGHLGYGALGSLYTNAPPNNSHIYGPVLDQVYHLPNHRLLDSEKSEYAKSFMPSKSAIYAANMPQAPAANTNKLARDEYLETNKVKYTYS